MYVMGISGMEHDAAACLVQDGELIAAVEEERFSRTKHIGMNPSDRDIRTLRPVCKRF